MEGWLSGLKRPPWNRVLSDNTTGSRVPFRHLRQSLHSSSLYHCASFVNPPHGERRTASDIQWSYAITEVA